MHNNVKLNKDAISFCSHCYVMYNPKQQQGLQFGESKTVSKEADIYKGKLRNIDDRSYIFSFLIIVLNARRKSLAD